MENDGNRASSLDPGPTPGLFLNSFCSAGNGDRLDGKIAGGIHGHAKEAQHSAMQRLHLKCRSCRLTI